MSKSNSELGPTASSGFFLDIVSNLDAKLASRIGLSQNVWANLVDISKSLIDPYLV